MQVVRRKRVRFAAGEREGEEERLRLNAYFLTEKQKATRKEPS